MVGMENDRHTIMLGEKVDMLRQCRCSENLRLMLIREGLAGIEAGTASGYLNNNVRTIFSGRCQSCICCCGTADIDGRESIASRTAGLLQGPVFFSADNARLDGWQAG